MDVLSQLAELMAYKPPSALYVCLSVLTTLCLSVCVLTTVAQITTPTRRDL